jgi:hypothetical protein
MEHVQRVLVYVAFQVWCGVVCSGVMHLMLMDGWMDGWMDYTGLARQSISRKAQYEAKAGGLMHARKGGHMCIPRKASYEELYNMCSSVAWIGMGSQWEGRGEV